MSTASRESIRGLPDDSSGVLSRSKKNFSLFRRQVPLRRQDTSEEGRALCICFVALLAVSVAGNVLLLVTVVAWTVNRSSVPRVESLPPQRRTPVCVPCTAIGVSALQPVPSDFLNVQVVQPANWTRGDQGTEWGRERLCCLDYPSHLNGLLKTLLIDHKRYEKGYLEETPGVNLSLPATVVPSAHLYLDSPPTSGVGGSAPRLLWTLERGYGTAHLHGNVSVDPSTGGLRVPEEGVYFVYSFITITTTAVTGRQFLHYVSRSHPRLPNTGEEILLYDKFSVLADVHTTKTSYLAGALKLRQGDVLSVHLSNATVVHRFWASNFIGLYRL